MKPRVDSSPRSSPGPLLTPTVKDESEEEYPFLQAAIVNDSSPRKKSPGKQRELVIEDYDEETR